LFKEVTVREPGYAYVFVSNEHPTYVDVYFDDVTVTHTPSPIVSSSDYFAFGLQHTTGERAGVYEQRYLYNGKELQDELDLGWLDYGLRMYDPACGCWRTIDPAAHKMPNWSPYAYAFNNPVRFIDVGGAYPYPVTIRAFAPPGAFKGSGFGDDKRGFSSNTNVTSRISQTITIDPTARTVSGGTPTSSDTHWNGMNVGNATESNSGGVDSKSFFKNSFGSDVAAVDASFEGSNPAFQGLAPDIEVQSSIILSENDKEGYLNVSIDLYSKQFPATEAIISDPSKQTIFLTGAAAFGDAGDLVNADSKKVATVDIRINIDKKGNFTGVIFGGKTYTISDWNKAQTAKPAGPFPRD
jgi:RHS repeat-associated protein